MPAAITLRCAKFISPLNPGKSYTISRAHVNTDRIRIRIFALAVTADWSDGMIEWRTYFAALHESAFATVLLRCTALTCYT